MLQGSFSENLLLHPNNLTSNLSDDSRSPGKNFLKTQELDRPSMCA